MAHPVSSVNVACLCPVVKFCSEGVDSVECLNLSLAEARIHAIQREQLLVRALFYQLTLVDHADGVRVADG